jgi:hypothetical protein
VQQIEKRHRPSLSRIHDRATPQIQLRLIKTGHQLSPKKKTLSQKRRSEQRERGASKKIASLRKADQQQRSISLWGGLLCTHTHRAFISKRERERARAGKKRRLLPGPFSTGAAWLLWLGAAAAAQWGCVLAGKSIDTQLQKRRLAAGRASHVPAARRSGRRPACKTRPPHTFAHTLLALCKRTSERPPRTEPPRPIDQS